MRVLTWNLFHGRSLPPAAEGTALAGAFLELIAAWSWDVALLQEVPPWWGPRLAARASAEQRTALTSRNALLPLRRLLAERWPEMTRSNGGGSNVVLVRGQGFRAYRSVMLRRRPERRVAQLARLADGTCVANLHASARVPLAEDELRRLWGLSLGWAAGSPLLLGGDLNLRSPQAPSAEIEHLAARDVDHLFGSGLTACSPAEVLPRRAEIGGETVELSDHPPLAVEVRKTALAASVGTCTR